MRVGLIFDGGNDVGDARDDRWSECVGGAGDPDVVVGGAGASPPEWEHPGARWLGAVRAPLSERERLTVASMDLAAGLRTLETMR